VFRAIKMMGQNVRLAATCEHVAVDTRLDPELISEGVARAFVRHIQTLSKERRAA